MDAWFRCETPIHSSRNARRQRFGTRRPRQLLMSGKTGFIIHDQAVKNFPLFSKEVLPAWRARPSWPESRVCAI